MGNFLTYIGNAAARVLTHVDLAGLGADVHELEQLGENKAISFVRGIAEHVEPELAQFITTHPAIAAEFHKLSDDEAAAEVATRTGAESTTTPAATPSADSAPAPATEVETGTSEQAPSQA